MHGIDLSTACPVKLTSLLEGMHLLDSSPCPRDKTRSSTEMTRIGEVLSRVYSGRLLAQLLNYILLHRRFQGFL